MAVVPVAAQDEAESSTEETETENAEKLMGQTEALDWALVVALCLAGTHFSAPMLRRFIETREAKISSIGGGMAASYVFIHLMSELDEGGDLVGSKIHHFVLFGFIIYYGIEYYLKRSTRDRTWAFGFLDPGDHWLGLHLADHVFDARIDSAFGFQSCAGAGCSDSSSDLQRFPLWERILKNFRQVGTIHSGQCSAHRLGR